MPFDTFPSAASTEQKTPQQEQAEIQALAREIYQNYGTHIYWLCLRIVRDPRTAQDMRQDVFLKIIKGLRSFKGESGLYTWIHTITQNHCFDFLRRRKRSVMIVSEDEISYEAEPRVESDEELIMSRADLAPYMRHCLPVTKLIVQLHFVEGYSHHEVAGILGFRRTVVTRRIRNFTQRAMQYSPALGKSIS